MGSKDETGPQEMTRRIVRYRGRVQGVGFRFTACRIARRFDVTGQVRNLPDGQVEVVVEGSAGEVAGFLKDLQRQMDRYIQETAQQTGFPTGEWSDFHVGYF